MTDWISVKDRLPKRMARYWINVSTDDQLFQQEAIYSEPHGGWLTKDGVPMVQSAISHWMLLPDPPEVSDD